MEVYERIKERRKQLGLSADDIAEALGISRATVFRYESRYIEKMPITILQPLAKILRCSPGYLMGWEDIDGNEIGAPKDDTHKKAEELYELYRKASPEIQAAVEILLKKATPGS